MDITNTEMLIVDKKTKEAVGLDGYFVYYADRPKLRKDFFFMFQNQLAQVAIDGRLNASDMRIMMLLLSKLDFENYINITQREIAELLKMQKPNVSRSMKNLIDAEIISKFKKGNITAYKLNPNYAWKGNIKDHDKAVINLDYERTARKKSKIQQEQSTSL